MKFLPTVLFFTLLFSCFTVFADEEYVCKNGDAERIISVVFESDQERVPVRFNMTRAKARKPFGMHRAKLAIAKTKLRSLLKNKNPGVGPVSKPCTRRISSRIYIKLLK